MTASPGSPRPAGAPITFTVSSAGCVSPQYEFWQETPSGTWTLVQPYGGGTAFTWDSTGAPAGSRNFAVWVAGAGSSNTYDQ